MAEEENKVDGKDFHHTTDAPPSPKHHRSDAKGYVAFRSDEEESSDGAEEETIKSPRDKKKIKKDTARSNTFRDKFRSIKVKKKDKDKEPKEKAKEKEKERDKDKEEKREKRDKKKHKRTVSGSIEQIPVAVQVTEPVFGVPLEVAVDRSKMADGVDLPRVFRDCIQYVEDSALNQEGIYRLSGVKSRIDQLKQEYDLGRDVVLNTYEPNIVTGLLKLYLRELPINVLTIKLLPAFDAVVGLNDEKEQVESYKHLLAMLPVANRTLISWLFVHLGHILDKSSENKMSIQNLSIVFSPTMAISHGILNIFFCHIKELFANTQIVRCAEPMPRRRPKPLALEHDESRLPDDPEALKARLAKEEEFLMRLHQSIKEENDDKNEEALLEELWEVQMRVTQIKRKLKVLKRRDASSRAKEDAQHQSPERKVQEGPQIQAEKDSDVIVAKTPTDEPTDTRQMSVESKNEAFPREEETEEEDLSEYLYEEQKLLIEHEELLEDNMLLKSRIERERNDIERLQQELAELMKRDQERSGSDTSDTDGSSESESDSEEDERELEGILQELDKENEALRRESFILIEKICEERQNCVRLRTQIRLFELEKERST